MSGAGLLGLILLSMGWLFFVVGAALNFQAWRRGRRAAIPVLPGVVGSLAALFTLGPLAQYGIDAPWPWLWILLPLFLDVHCLGRVLAIPFKSRGP
jgi:hypothetical protein